MVIFDPFTFSISIFAQVMPPPLGGFPTYVTWYSIQSTSFTPTMMEPEDAAWVAKVLMKKSGRMNTFFSFSGSLVSVTALPPF